MVIILDCLSRDGSSILPRIAKFMDMMCQLPDAGTKFPNSIGERSGLDFHCCPPSYWILFPIAGCNPVGFVKWGGCQVVRFYQDPPEFVVSRVKKARSSRKARFNVSSILSVQVRSAKEIWSCRKIGNPSGL